MGKTTYDDTRYSIDITQDDVQALRSIGKKSIVNFTQEDINLTENWAKKYQEELGVKSPFFRAWFGDWREYETMPYRPVTQSKDSYLKAGKTINADTGKYLSWGVGIRGESSIHAGKDKIAIQAINDIQSITENAILFDSVVSTPNSKSKMPNTAFMHSFYALYNAEEGTYLLKLFVEEALSTNGVDVFTRAYELKDIKKVADIPRGVLSNNEGLTDGTSTSIVSICDLFELVKTHDKDFSYKPVSKYVLNADGTPKVFYHQTDGDFNVFDTYRKTAVTHC